MCMESKVGTIIPRFNILQATKDIVVWKELRLSRKGDSGVSPYRNKRYKKGMRYYSPIILRYGAIYEGLHAFQIRGDHKNRVRMIIPKWAWYVKGSYGHIVASDLVWPM